MTPISDAVILMAGAGSRLRSGAHKIPKPLVPLLGRPLVSYTLDALARAGIKKVYAVVGFESEALVSGLERIAPRALSVCFIENRDWRKQNGVSVLAAASYVQSPFLLTMADHLFEHSIVDLLLRDPVENELNLAIDRKLDSIFDLEDAMKVQTRGDRVVAIGKDLQDYDAIDTGLFVCPKNFFDCLERAKKNDDCSLADGVRLMSADEKVRAVDVGAAWWQDVDTPEMFKRAEQVMAQRKQPAAR